MGIEAKHAYRFGFLKSEEWSNIRLERLSKDDARCVVCGFRSLSNDEHHVSYPDRWRNTDVRDLRTLCRDCHELLHEILIEEPDWDWPRCARFLRRVRKNFPLTELIAWIMHTNRRLADASANGLPIR